MRRNSSHGRRTIALCLLFRVQQFICNRLCEGMFQICFECGRRGQVLHSHPLPISPLLQTPDHCFVNSPCFAWNTTPTSEKRAILLWWSARARPKFLSSERSGKGAARLGSSRIYLKRSSASLGKREVRSQRTNLLRKS